MVMAVARSTEKGGSHPPESAIAVISKQEVFDSMCREYVEGAQGGIQDLGGGS